MTESNEGDDVEADDIEGGERASDATDRERVERAIELAEESVEMGNTPFGALIVVDGEIVGEGHNETRSNDDLAAHPEMTLARWAGRELDDDERARCTMYASTEPCPMCATAIHYAGLDRVVYGVSGETLDELTGGVVTIPCEEVIRRADGDTTVEGPIATEAAMALHESFYGDDSAEEP
jgi:tRNA(Arg) A34 adenosine deaminase TadA